MQVPLGASVSASEHGPPGVAGAGRLEGPVLASFTADVNQQLGRVEAILKVVGSPPGSLVDTCVELMPGAAPSDFQRVLDLKVLPRRQDYTAILEQFGRRMGRPVATGQAAALGFGGGRLAPGPAGGGGSSSSFRMPGSTNAAASKASAAAQDMAARFK